jgi:N-acetyl-gamma-glutamyl-phosphate reductase
VKITASIIGASGYTGVELIKLLLRHPSVEVKNVYAHSSAGKRVAEMYPVFAKTTDLTFQPMDDLAKDTNDLLFVALPHNESQKVIPPLMSKKKIIDLGGDFRLKDPSVYSLYYHAEHTAPDALSEVVYGLPEVNSERIRKASFVANPGCYPTSAILALAPLAAKKLLPLQVSVISLSGVSGAGRTPSVKTHFAEANESVSAYKVGSHQHTPEIEQTLSELADTKVGITFVPHLLPITRGIHTTVTLPLMNNYTLDNIRVLYEQFYASAPFVRLLSEPPHIKDANYTNFCDIHIGFDSHSNTLIILSTIDNLVKGAGGQAIQNMNLMYGLPETEGLLF